ncbi:MAG: cobalamin-binding protein [Gammaproteobacteria bacterium]|nr:cobalamin-binding protein [Gammaproteobacteria bacterium]
MTEPDSPRIVSLLPSATEIVCALGFADRIVGRSHECDFPAGLEDLPVVSVPRLDVDGSSKRIDDEVRDIVRRGLSVYEVREDVLKSLKPDFIVTQTQCEVCAVSEQDVAQAVSDWTGTRPEIISLEPNLLDDVWSDVRRTAEALDARARGDRVVDVLRSRMRAIADRAATMEEKPTVATIEWIEPLMSGGNWMPELVEMAGGDNLFGEAGKHSPWIEWPALREADPDVILVMPCGFNLERTLSEAKALEQLSGWEELAAVRTGRCHAADGHHYFNRPGPRLAESLEILAQVLHPDQFDFGHGPERCRTLGAGFRRPPDQASRDR